MESFLTSASERNKLPVPLPRFAPILQPDHKRFLLFVFQEAYYLRVANTHALALDQFVSEIGRLGFGWRAASIVSVGSILRGQYGIPLSMSLDHLNSEAGITPIVEILRRDSPFKTASYDPSRRLVVL